MLIFISVLFFIALAGGSYVASIHFKNKFPSPKVALIHGLVGSVALILLIGIMSMNQDFTLAPALCLFVIVILGGLFLFSFRNKKSGPPKPVIIIHGSLAVLAFSTLLYLGFWG